MSDFKVGQTVELLDGRQAVIRFIGTLHIAEGQFVGVEFSDPSGKNDGSVRGERYFDCPQNHGMFMRATNIAQVIIESPKPKAAPKVKQPPASPTRKPAPRHSRQSMAPPPNRRASVMAAPTPSATSRATPSRPVSSTLSSRTAASVAASTTKLAANRLSLSNRTRLSPTSSAPTTASSSNLALARKPTTPSTSSSTKITRTPTQDKKVDEIETKLRVLEKQRLEDREQLKALERVQQERDKFESIIQNIQAKYQPVQQENAELKKQLKEAEVLTDKIEVLQEEHDVQLEMVVLDREMAEEKAENATNELADLRQRVEELELENEILKEENVELGQDISPEEKTSASWIQMEKENERLRDVVIRLRDISREQEADFRSQIKSLEEDAQELAQVKQQHDDTKAKLLETEADVQDLRHQLDAALGAEEMIETLSDQNLSLKEKIEELNLEIADLQDIKELNDELEINHVENEKELRQEIELKEMEIADGLRAVAQHEEALATQEYAIVKYRETFATLQSDLEEMRANKEISEIESQDLAHRSKELADLNIKLNQSVVNTMVTTIDMELRKLDAQEASEHLSIVQLFLPEAFQSERDSVLGLLRCRRISFKAKLLHSLIREPLNAPGKQSVIQEEDLFEVCDALNQLVWIAEMADRFISSISSSSLAQFARFGSQGAIYELEPVERALDSKIAALRKNDFPGRTVSEELQRSVAVLKHLASQHAICDSSTDRGADELKMSIELILSNLDVTVAGLSLISHEVEKKIAVEDEDDSVMRFIRKSDAVIAAGRSAKIVAGKTLRALQDLRSRSLSLTPETHPDFKTCEESTAHLAQYCRVLGNDLLALLMQEGTVEQPQYSSVRTIISKTTASFFSESPIDSDIYSNVNAKLRNIAEALSNLLAISTSLTRTIEFERNPAPWNLKAQEIAASNLVSNAAQDEIEALQVQLQQQALSAKMLNQDIEEKGIKIELLEARTRDASKKASKLNELEHAISRLQSRSEALEAYGEKRDREIRRLEQEREGWADTAKMHSKRSEAGSSSGVRNGSADTQALEKELEAAKKNVERYRKSVQFLRNENLAVVRAEKQRRREKMDVLAAQQHAEDEQAPEATKGHATVVIKSLGKQKVERNMIPKYLTASLMPTKQASSRVVLLTRSLQGVSQEVAKLTPKLNALQVTPQPKEKRLKWTPKSKSAQSQLDSIESAKKWEWSPWSAGTFQRTMEDVHIHRLERFSPIKGLEFGGKWMSLPAV